jgi:hypothetical protein
MPIVIIIEKNGDLREKKIKDDIEPDELYKVVKLKNSDDFENEASWEVDVDDKTYNISLFAKTTGNAGQENKYELPPPVDDILYFGKSILINEDGSDLTLRMWHKIYEALFGGFEDIGDEDSDEEEEDLTGVELTKDGYMKDSFIADSDDDDVDSGDYIDSDDEYQEGEIIEGKRKRHSKRKLSEEDMNSESGDDSDYFIEKNESDSEEYE